MSIIPNLRNITYQEITQLKILNNFGLRTFELGILLLAAAPVLSISFLIFSAIVASFTSEENYFKDKYNYPFLIISFLMILNCILLYWSDKVINSIQITNAWIGLLNWIPLFWCFWSFQKYLYSKKLRTNAAKLLIIGSIPVLMSGFFQYFLGIYGPFRFLNNLIIWYQRPLGQENGVTGLFNNQNYAGAWLCILLPLCFGFLLRRNKNILKKFLISLISLKFIYMIVLTSSRNAILSIFIAIFLFTRSIKKKLFSLLTLISLLYIVKLLPLTTLNNQNNIFNFIPFELIKKTSINNIHKLFYSPRLEIWSKSFELIKSNSLMGFGAGSFGSVYTQSNGEFSGIQHPHNLFIEIAFSHGIIPALILIGMFIYFIIISLKINQIGLNTKAKELKLYRENLDKAWIISFIIFFLIHIFDITYFDGRISIICWILLSGMICMIKENKRSNKYLRSD